MNKELHDSLRGYMDFADYIIIKDVPFSIDGKRYRGIGGYPFTGFDEMGKFFFSQAKDFRPLKQANEVYESLGLHHDLEEFIPDAEAAKEIHRLIDQSGESYNLIKVYCDKCRSFPENDLPKKFLGYDIAIPGGYYFSAIPESFSSDYYYQIQQKYFKLLNSNMLCNDAQSCYEIMESYIKIDGAETGDFTLFKLYEDL